MSQKHFKSNPFYKQSALNVDSENGVIKNIVIAQHGLNKNGTYFNDDFLEALVVQGNEQTNGVKSRFGHPNMCASSLGTFLGRYKGFRIKDRKVYANLELDETAKDTPNGNLYSYVLKMADKNPDMFGNSIVVSAQVFEEEINNELFESLILDSFIASDIVDEPAATDSLFENSEDLGIITTQFLNENPQIFEAISRDTNVIADFLGRYATYHKNKFNTNVDMSILNDIMGMFGKKETFDVDVTLANGNIVSVVTDGETPQKGDSVKKEDGSPLEDGNHITKDEETWVIVDGAIEEIMPKEVEEEEPLESEELATQEVMQSIKDLNVKFEEVLSTFNNDKKETKETLEFLAKELVEGKDKFETLASSIGSSFNIDDEGQMTSLKSSKEKKSSLDTLKQRKEQIKNKA